jgi:hypothetical protein
MLAGMTRSLIRRVGVEDPPEMAVDRLGARIDLDGVGSG